MNLRGAQAEGFLRKPPKDAAGALIYGADAMRVADARARLVRAVAGEGAAEEMRVTRLGPPELKGEPGAVLDELKAVGFFPGPRVVVVEGVTEAQAKPVLAALDGWAPGDAALVVTAGALKKTSKIRKAFEAHRSAAAVGLYDDPPGREEIEAAIQAENLRLTPEGRRDVDALAQALDPGDFRQTLTKIALYAGDEVAGPEAVALMAPATVDADLDEVIHAAAEGRSDAIGPLMRRLAGQGVSPVQLAIFATRHFGQLHGAAAGTAQPWGPRRDAMQRQARAWGGRRLEGALALLMETDLVLRSASSAPQMAVMERALIRLSRMAAARD
ncbi:DNA polymerase III subunit delta [Jannaschia sp. W003]|uniref:DNA polymerase III subunit delta n=1 Tax=Jannaschia sp. W003 TaxID=2867012 RepID=UPI0021A34A79|nr:DNA polymerase III subunit delta [Jannaschia sp. W003]UWQ22131.1 DNA polymerase III subunit delta [Jannaschia sp. W003]